MTTTKVLLHCKNWRDALTCGFVKWLYLGKLTVKVGCDHGSMHDDLVPHIFCANCGGTKVSLAALSRHAADGRRRKPALIMKRRIPPKPTLRDYRGCGSS